MPFKQAIEKIKSTPGVAEVIALAGGLVFLLQALRWARLQESILDEGLYLVKGILFASGRYIPFQADGPWTNQMPLSYFIPGYVQMLFGSGLRTGRYFSIFLGLLILLGLWIVARRLGGRWWAAAVVWMIGISPAFANGYSMAVSQALVAGILIWILVLAVDEQARFWRLILACLLAGLLVLVRVNMTPVLPLLAGYMIWQFGWRKGLWAGLAGVLVIVIGHALYWPGILQNWASWVPSSVAPFLDPWRIEKLGIAVWDPNPALEDRLASLADGIRFNIIPVLALALFGVLVLQRRFWTNLFHYRTAVFLTLTSGVLFLAHAWAALLKSYCVYCFSGYLAFFSPMLVLLIVLVFCSWKPGPAKWYALFVLLVLPVLFGGVGYGASRQVGPWLIELSIPRLNAGRLQVGSIPLWGLLENRFAIDYKTSRWLIPLLAGVLLALLLAGAAYLVYRAKWFQRARLANYGLLLAALALILATLLTPTTILSGSEQTRACQGDVLAAMQEAGNHLASFIPAGSSVYWKGSLSAVPLLSLTDARLYPAQLNDGYSYRLGGDTAALRKFGLWNDELSNQWRQEADFIILQQRNYDQEWKQFLESGDFNELPASPRTDPCLSNTQLRIFRRIKDAS